jgi:hypothetical protein
MIKISDKYSKNISNFNDLINKYETNFNLIE